MAPPKRKPENKGLPARWVKKHGAFYYIVPEGQKAAWDGKAWFRLGATLAEAYAEWAKRMAQPDRITTIGALFDRYLLEVVPTNAPKSQTEKQRHIRELRGVFGHMALADLEPQHVYQYADKRTAKVAGKREVETLSHAFSKAVEWGLMKAHPFKGEVRLSKGEARDRYVEDWEIIEAMRLKGKTKHSRVPMVQAYLRIKLLTGLRKGDILRLGVANDQPDGLHVQPGKTRKSTGKRLIYEWTPELREAVEAAKACRPALSPYLFCNQHGNPLFEAEKGTTKGFDDIWQRFMARLLAETEIKERFTEHDLRAKVGSDAESLERARELLAHASDSTTKKVYRRKPERIKPVR